MELNMRTRKIEGIVKPAQKRARRKPLEIDPYGEVALEQMIELAKQAEADGIAWLAEMRWDSVAAMKERGLA